MTQASASTTANRAPPNHLDAERSVLGSVLIRPMSLDDVSGMLLVDDFFLPAHREIYEALQALAKAGKPIDVVTLSDELRKAVRTNDRGAVTGNGLTMLEGGEAYLLKLANAVPTAENVRHYARIVREKAVLRRVIAACAEASALAYGDGDVEEVLGGLRRSLAEVEIGDDGGPIKIGDAMPKALDELESKSREPDRFAVMTGNRDFDQKIGGLRRGQAVFTAANPGMGKTSWALGVLRRAATMHKIPGLIFSLEMSVQELIERMLGSEGCVPPIDLVRGRLDFEKWKKIHAASKRVGPLPIWLHDEKIRIGRLLAEARRWRARHTDPEKLALIIVDYLGLVRPDEKGETRNREVGEMGADLKLLAKELKCPVVIVSQLNRENIKRGKDGKPQKPVMSDLRDSGELEQHADMCIFPWRENMDDSPGQGLRPAELIVAKHRNGPKGLIEVLWDGDLMTFYDNDHQHTFAALEPDRRFPDA